MFMAFQPWGHFHPLYCNPATPIMESWRPVRILSQCSYVNKHQNNNKLGLEVAQTHLLPAHSVFKANNTIGEHVPLCEVGMIWEFPWAQWEWKA